MNFDADHCRSVICRLAGRLLPLAALAISVPVVNAAPATGLEQLSQAALEHVESFYPELSETAEVSSTNTAKRRVEIEVGYIDPRLELGLCQRPLSARLNQNQRPVGRITVKVQCDDASPWSKYVPVTIRVYEPVLVAARPPPRGTLIEADDIKVRETDISTVRDSYIDEPELAVGMEVRRAMQVNAAVTVEALASPTVIQRGDTVTLTAQAGPVVIRQQAVALQDGQLGKRINVRNSNSDRVVRALVTGRGQAEVALN